MQSTLSKNNNQYGNNSISIGEKQLFVGENITQISQGLAIAGE